VFDVAGYGASSIDLVYVLPAYPAPEGPLSKLPIQSHTLQPGGQTATAMAGCAALGLRAAYLGATGSDARGALVRDALSARGVDISHAAILEAPQPYAVILLAEGQAERIVLWHRDPKFSRDEYSRLVAAASGARLLHVDDTDEPGAIAAAREARARGRLVTTDIDRLTDRTKELVALATHPVLAEHIPAQLTGEPDVARALRALRALTPAPIIVTRGAAGAVALDRDTIVEAPGFRVGAIDTTGAGDVFRAGFITALLDAQPLAMAMRFANAAAAASCTVRGAMASVPSRADVEKILREA
jgi:sugar/nucleoside kinase (ribokinase family)